MLLKDLTDDQRAIVQKIAHTRTYRDGTAVIEEGAVGDSFFLVLEGRLEVHKQIDAGREKYLKELGPDEFFGEMSFFDGATRSATVLACGTCRLLEIDRPTFDQLMASHPLIGAHVCHALARELARRLRTNNEELRRTILWAIEGWTAGS